MSITTDLSTEVGQFRLHLGDTSEPALFTDTEAAFFISQGGNVMGGLELAVNALELRYARAYDVTIDGQSLNRSQIGEAIARARDAQRAGGSVSTAYVTRQDAYSDDVPASDTRSPGSLLGHSRYDLTGYDLDDPDHDIPE